MHADQIRFIISLEMSNETTRAHQHLVIIMLSGIKCVNRNEENYFLNKIYLRNLEILFN